MAFDNLAIGRIGEDLAASFLRKKGFKILTQNFRYGHTELDIVAEYKEVIHFIEVKTRRSLRMGKPYEAVVRRKVKNLLKTAHIYLLQTKRKKNRLSLDVISIVLDSNNSARTIDFFENITL